jgi:hypothetical protein
MKYTWLFFVAGAALTWGAYVVTIDHGRTKLAQGLPRTAMPVAAMRAFLFIGLAYFALGVVVPAIYLFTHKLPPGQDPGLNMRGSVLSTIAGILGAAGALCIVFAVAHARRSGAPGAALYVAPLVFAFAPIINCLISLAVEPPDTKPGIGFYLGLVMAAAGAALVLINKPEGHKPAAGAPGHAQTQARAPAQTPAPH